VKLILYLGVYKIVKCLSCSVAAPAPRKNFDAAPAAPASTIPYTKPTFSKQTKVNRRVGTVFSSELNYHEI
jgi:hypothetical protein